MTEIKINSEFITLTQLLKIANLISSGGEAKFFLASVHIKVNGVDENRRGKKLYPGDTVEIQGTKYAIATE